MSIRATLLTAALHLAISGLTPALAQVEIIPNRTDSVYFLTGGSQLDQTAITQLDALALLLDSQPMQDACIRLTGHSDSVGKAMANMRLSKLRADRVAEYLATKLAQPKRIIEIAAVGSDAPLSDYSPDAKQQRRVSFEVKKCSASELGQS